MKLPPPRNNPEFNFQNLYRAYLDCRKNKRYTYHAAKFELNLERELLKLEHDLQTQTYKISRSICFVVTIPTLREVFAATFRDRVVHHLLYNFLEPIFEPKLIDQSFACRKSKGTHQSLEYLSASLRKITHNNTRPAYFLHLDIKGFFMSLDKNILYGLIEKEVKNPKLLWLTKLIIFADPTENFLSKSPQSLFNQVPQHKSLFHAPKDRGLPIGNLSSQFFANVYLNGIDQFAKHKMKVKYYLRYVDDMLFLSNDLEELKIWRDGVNEFIENRLGLKLNFKKQILQPVDKGIDWLGYFVRPESVLIRPRVVKAFKRKLYIFNQILQNSLFETQDEKSSQLLILLPVVIPDFCTTKIRNDKNAKLGNKTVKGQLSLPFTDPNPSIEVIEKMLATINSYFGHFGHANTYQLKKHLYNKHFQKLNEYIEPKNKHFSTMQMKNIFIAKSKKTEK